MRGAKLVVEGLIRHGVRHVFGLPGDTSYEWYDALCEAEGITHVLTTDERNAAYMADAYARVTNGPGVCEGPSGAGLTYMLPGIAEANESSVPLIAINTDIETFHRGRSRLTEIDQVNLCKPITRWSTSIDDVRSISRTIRKAFSLALGPKPGAVHLALPRDVLAAEAGGAEGFPADGSRWEVPRHRMVPGSQWLEAAAWILARSERPVIIAGGGVHRSGAYDALRRFAEALRAPVGTSISGKGAMAEDHELCLGVVGSTGGSELANQIVAEADTVLFVGTQTGSVVTRNWTLPPLVSSRKVIQVDTDAGELDKNYLLDVSLLGDAKVTLEHLLVLLGQQSARVPSRSGWRVGGTIRAWRRRELEACEDRGGRCHPGSVVNAVQELAPHNALFLLDAGTPIPYFAAYFESPVGRHFLIPRGLGGLGWALPAMVGAHYALEDKSRKIIAVMGDGSMLMSMNELVTISSLGVNGLIILFHNNEYSWIKAGQKCEGFGRFLSVDFKDHDFCGIARAMGIDSVAVRDTPSFRTALQRALARPGTSLIDVFSMPLWEAVPPVQAWREKFAVLTQQGT